jgi:hypothetical protein
METNEGLERALMQVAEKQGKQFLEKLESLEQGDLKSLEEQRRETINTMGCLMMENTLRMKMQEETASKQQEGSCGHPMRWVAIRGKRWQTLMGPVTLWRGYYQCAGSKPEEEESSPEPVHAAHGEAPADEVWGVQQHRCSVGVQQAISRLCSSLTRGAKLLRP